MLEAAELAVRSAVCGERKTEPLAGAEFQGTRGAFVTLRKHGELRGCIGRVKTDEVLATTIGEVAVQSALSDPRFDRVSPSELNDLEYEISVLTELEPIELDGIEIGRHGVEIELKGRRAIFLPQVATEEQWDRDEMLTHLCRKAGLPDDGWKSSEAKLFGFEAEVFGN
jgi:AmmeMemoRadiSam system protein A